MSKEGIAADVITIVSGLPRSGTSMMMKMLTAAQFPLLVDNIRTADEDNPKGYYEFEKVKDLEKDNSWLDLARGKAVKIVSPLLQYLNMDKKYSYKIIFMLRNIDEILASQKKMANRLKYDDKNIGDDTLKKNYSAHLEEVEKWIAQHDNVEALYVNYSDVIANPLETAEGVSEFLGVKANSADVAGTIDSSLYRNRSEGADDGRVSLAPEEAEDRDAIADRLKQLGYL